MIILNLVVWLKFVRDDWQISKKSYSSQPTWLQFANSSTPLEEFFSDVDIPFDCQFLVAQSVEETVTLTEVYRVRGDLPLQTFHFGTWRPNEGLVTTQLGFHERRNDLQGIQLKAVVIDDPSSIVQRCEGEVRVVGFIGRAIQELCNALNFTVNFSVQEDGKFGEIYRNGTMDGMIQKINDRTVDIVANSLFYTSARGKVLDFTVPIIYRKLRMFIKMPSSTDLKWQSLFAPFSWTLWLTIGVATIVIGFYLGFVNSIWKKFNELNENPLTVRFSFPDSSFCVIGLFLQQGYDVTPSHSFACQLIVFITSISSMVLMASYSGVVISFLAVNHINLPFNDVKSLLNDRSYKVGVAGVPQDYRTSNNNETGMTDLHLLMDKINEDKNPPKTIKEGLLRVCSSNFAFLIPVNFALSLQKSLPCQIVAIPMVKYGGSQSLPLTKNSPYRTALNYMLHKLQSSGTLKKLRYGNYDQKWKNVQQKNVGVHLNDVAAIFVFLLVGILLALTISVLEFLLYKCRASVTQSRTFSWMP